MALKEKTLHKYVSLATDILKEVAQGKRQRKHITYRELMHEMGGPGRGYIAEVLEEVSCNEVAIGHPFITALVVHSHDYLPGKGFWYIRVLPDTVKNASKTQKLTFWKLECEKVWSYWMKNSK